MHTRMAPTLSPHLNVAPSVSPPWKTCLERLSPSMWQALLSPHVRAFRAPPGLEGYQESSCFLAASPDPSPSSTLLRLEVRFERQDTFISTERAAALPSRRQPARDRYLAVLERTDASAEPPLRVVSVSPLQRQIVPTAHFLRCLEVLEQDAGYRALLDPFLEKGWTGTRLEARPQSHAPSWLERIRGKVPPPPLPPPPQQLKFTLEQWIPAGAFALGSVCSDLRLESSQLPALEEVMLDEDALQVGIELSEQPVSRHIHWGFRGTFVRVLLTSQRLERWVWQRV